MTTDGAHNSSGPSVPSECASGFEGDPVIAGRACSMQRSEVWYSAGQQAGQALTETPRVTELATQDGGVFSSSVPRRRTAAV